MEVFVGACRVSSDRIRCAIERCREAIANAEQALENAKTYLSSIKVSVFFFWKTTLWDKWVASGYYSYGSIRKLAPDLLSERDVKILDAVWSYKSTIATIEVFECESEVFLNPCQLKFVKEWEKKE